MAQPKNFIEEIITASAEGAWGIAGTPLGFLKKIQSQTTQAPKDTISRGTLRTESDPYSGPKQAQQVLTGSPANIITGPPRFHCTGPVSAWVRFPERKTVINEYHPDNFAGPIYLLGTCEQHPTSEEEVIYLPVYDDESTHASPRDKEYAGSKETIVLPLNKFNYGVLNAVLSVPRYGRGEPTKQVTMSAGTNGHLDRGMLSISAGLFFELWLVNSYFGSRIWASGFPDMPNGTYYPFCQLAMNSIPKQGAGGTQVRMIAVEANWQYYSPAGLWMQKSSDLKYMSQIRNGIKGYNLVNVARKVR